MSKIYVEEKRSVLFDRWLKISNCWIVNLEVIKFSFTEKLLSSWSSVMLCKMESWLVSKFEKKPSSMWQFITSHRVQLLVSDSHLIYIELSNLKVQELPFSSVYWFANKSFHRTLLTGLYKNMLNFHIDISVFILTANKIMSKSIFAVLIAEY